MSGLELRGLTKAFGTVRALDAVDLRVEPAELCVLLGPSGCGKSTLLRCVAGLESPDGGEILLDGKRANETEPKARNVAMVFQNYALYPHWDVRRNLEFPLRMRGTARAERDRRVLETARLLRIDDLLGRRPGQLSGGQRQRVAIGRAIVRDPSLFLFDEPLSNLDAQLRQEMRLEIVRLHRRLRTTVLYVTHDQVEAMTLGQRLVVLRAGRIEQVGTPKEVYARPATRFVAGFVGAPAMNLVDGAVADGIFARGDLRVPVVPSVRGAATLGVRPEDVRLGDGPGLARVEWVEDLGPERYAHLRAGDVVLTARGDAAEGADIRFGFDPARLHLFVDGTRVD